MTATLAEVHLAPGLTLPLLAAALLAAALYWRRLGRASVPGIRRRLRRGGLLVGLVAAIAGVAALSFLDPEIRPGGYLLAWSVVAVLLVPAVAIAAFDAIVTVRFHQQSLDRRAARDARRIRAAVEAAGGRPESPTTRD